MNNSIPEPTTLKSRPHFRGMPVPVTATIKSNGVPDFAAINWQKMWQLGRLRQCALCGQQMSSKKKVAFLGGPLSLENRLFADGPMHPLCALYATTVCPWLRGDKTEYRLDSILEFDPTQSSERPDRMAIILNMTYEMGMVPVSKRVMYHLPDEPEFYWLDDMDIQVLYQRLKSMGEVEQ